MSAHASPMVPPRQTRRRASWTGPLPCSSKDEETTPRRLSLSQIPPASPALCDSSPSFSSSSSALPLTASGSNGTIGVAEVAAEQVRDEGNDENNDLEAFFGPLRTWRLNYPKQQENFLSMTETDASGGGRDLMLHDKVAEMASEDPDSHPAPQVPTLSANIHNQYPTEPRNSKHLRLYAMRRRNSHLSSTCTGGEEKKEKNDEEKERNALVPTKTTETTTTTMTTIAPFHVSPILYQAKDGGGSCCNTSDQMSFVGRLPPTKAENIAVLIDGHVVSSRRQKRIQRGELQTPAPSNADIICTRHISAQTHPGNVAYHQLVAHVAGLMKKEQNHRTYSDKLVAIDHAAKTIVHTIRRRNIRFLSTDKNKKVYWDIGDAGAIQKTSKLLRQVYDGLTLNNGRTRGDNNHCPRFDPKVLKKMVLLSESKEPKHWSRDIVDSAVNMLVIPPKPTNLADSEPLEMTKKRKVHGGQDNHHNKNNNKPPSFHGTAGYCADSFRGPDQISSLSMEDPAAIASLSHASFENIMQQKYYHHDSHDWEPIPASVLFSTTGRVQSELPTHPHPLTPSSSDIRQRKRMRSHSLPLQQPSPPSSSKITSRRASLVESHCGMRHCSAVATIPHTNINVELASSVEPGRLGYETFVGDWEGPAFA